MMLDSWMGLFNNSTFSLVLLTHKAEAESGVGIAYLTITTYYVSVPLIIMPLVFSLNFYLFIFLSCSIQMVLIYKIIIVLCATSAG